VRFAESEHTIERQVNLVKTYFELLHVGLAEGICGAYPRAEVIKALEKRSLKIHD
jgi:hypothetical protein